MQKIITTIILTYNEEIHIERCLKLAKKYSKEIYLVDSYSDDKTILIAKKFGAKILQNKFVNYSQQFSWALKKINIKTPWTLRLDADEYLEDKLVEELNYKLKHLSKNIVGINFKRKHIFMNKWIKYGGRYPLILLRLWRTGKAFIEDRWMDEHMVIKEGKQITFKNCFCDHNLKDLNFLINKHNWYASREAVDKLIAKLKLNKQSYNSLNIINSALKTGLVRLIKNNFYNKLPFGIGPFLYFMYRYFFLIGFLDGFRGFIYHFMQGFWYRCLVDAKVLEYQQLIKKIKSKKNKLKILSSNKNLKLNLSN